MVVVVDFKNSRLCEIAHLLSDIVLESENENIEFDIQKTRILLDEYYDIVNSVKTELTDEYNKIKNGSILNILD